MTFLVCYFICLVICINKSGCASLGPKRAERTPEGDPEDGSDLHYVNRMVAGQRTNILSREWRLLKND